MKKKRFYNDKKRNQKWTEPEQGRKIDFADKYIEGGSSDKFDYKRPKKKGYSADSKSRNETRLKRLIVFVCCVAIISVGYTGMDVYIQRHAKPAMSSYDSENIDGAMSDMQVGFFAKMTDGIGLDASVMLSSIMNSTQKNGYSAVAFEAKRADGTIGYKSSLASVDTFSAVSFAADKPQQSVQEMLKNDILPVAVISCYMDNVVPAQASGAAIMNGKKVYKDADGNTYLNPDSDFAYNYIKDIIVELNTFGVTVFVLDNCNLPEKISKKYGDGYEKLAKKLYSDIDSNIKLLEAVNVKVSKDTQINDLKALKRLGNSKAYIIKTDLNGKAIVSALQKKGIASFVIK